MTILSLLSACLPASASTAGENQEAANMPGAGTTSSTYSSSSAFANASAYAEGSENSTGSYEYQGSAVSAGSAAGAASAASATGQDSSAWAYAHAVSTTNGPAPTDNSGDTYEEKPATEEPTKTGGGEPDDAAKPDGSEKTGGNEPEPDTNRQNAASNAVSAFASAYLMSCAETTTLHQRLGYLRANNSESGGWFRAYGGKFEYAAKSFAREFDMKYGGVQAGYDGTISVPDGRLYIGAMFGYAKGDLKSQRRGKGGVDSKTVGAYATYLHSNGMYADMTLKYQWMDNRLDAASGRAAGNSARTGGPAASLEIGRRFNIGAPEKQRWYLEPHAQLSYSRQSGGTFRAPNGLNITADGFTSLIGRAGVTIGYDNGKTNVFFKAAREREFDGEVSIIAGGERITGDFGGSRWLFGIGVTSKLDDRNSIYLTIDRAEGDSFSRPWAINAGWRIIL